MSVKENVSELRAALPKQVCLVAVSKTKPNEMILEAYETGQRVFGENKVQELREKAEQLPKDIEWHFIGHLQTNKVKYIAPFIHLIHAVDSIKLLKTINKEAKKNNRVIGCLLQFHIAEEQTKYGLDINDAREILESEAYQSLENIKLLGVMGMATYSDQERQVRQEFSTLKNIFLQLKEQFFLDQPDFKEISMGMSGDYQMAIEEGSTMVRVGTSLFGARNYAG